MWKTVAVALCCVLISSGVNGSAKIPNDKDTLPVIPDSSTTSSTTSSSTTTSPTTTIKPEPTTSSTPKPDPTTPSTPIPTKPPTPPTTTHAPPKPTPTPPTPVPDPQKGKWNVTQGNETMIVQMAAQLVVMFNTTVSKNVSEIALNIPNDNKTVATGSFDKYQEAITLSWPSKGKGNDSVTLHFIRNNQTYVLNGLDISIEPEDLPNITPSITLKLVNKQQYFNTSLQNSYRCVRLQTFNLTTVDGAIIAGYLKVSDLHLQAFNTDKSGSFGLAEDCAFDTSDVVPIAVGCVLAGLVVIVLAVYLISRRRSQAGGYVSM